MADHSTGGGEGEVIDRPEDRGGPMEAQPRDQTVMEETTGASAAATGHGDCDHGREQEVGDGGNERTLEGEQRATEMNGA